MLELSVKLPRKRAFVTGAGSGLGLAICEALAEDRWTIGMCDVREDALKSAVKRVESLGGIGIDYCFNVSDKRAFKKALDKFAHDQNGMDLLVNNAGMAGGGWFGEFQIKDWEEMLETNVLGTVNGCHYAAPYMKEKRYGHILNVSSAAAVIPVPRMTAYCTASAAIKMLSEALYSELHDYNVGVSVLMPYFFRSPLPERVRGDAAEQWKWQVENAEHSAAEVAAAALAGVARNDLHLYFPNKVRLYSWLWRLAPQRFVDYVRKANEQRYHEVEQLRGARPLPEEGS